jgi:hypothetical protein
MCVSCRAQKAGIDPVRGADEMKIAQHFSAGIRSRLTNESVKRTTEIEGFPRTRILLSALFAIVNLFSAVRFADWFDHPTEPQR